MSNAANAALATALAAAVFWQARELTLGLEIRLATAALLVGSRQARFQAACAR